MYELFKYEFEKLNTENIPKHLYEIIKESFKEYPFVKLNFQDKKIL